MTNCKMGQIQDFWEKRFSFADFISFFLNTSVRQNDFIFMGYGIFKR